MHDITCGQSSCFQVILWWCCHCWIHFLSGKANRLCAVQYWNSCSSGFLYLCFHNIFNIIKAKQQISWNLQPVIPKVVHLTSRGNLHSSCCLGFCLIMILAFAAVEHSFHCQCETNHYGFRKPIHVTGVVTNTTPLSITASIYFLHAWTWNTCVKSICMLFTYKFLFKYEVLLQFFHEFV